MKKKMLISFLLCASFYLHSQVSYYLNKYVIVFNVEGQSNWVSIIQTNNQNYIKREISYSDDQFDEVVYVIESNSNTRIEFGKIKNKYIREDNEALEQEQIQIILEKDNKLHFIVNGKKYIEEVRISR
jgi:hypothetical protein